MHGNIGHYARRRPGVVLSLAVRTALARLTDAVLDLVVGDPTLALLERMEDRQLADIGLSRMDIHEAGRHPRAARNRILARAAATRRRLRQLEGC